MIQKRMLLLTPTPVQTVSKDIPDIIKAAAESPLGIFALILLLVAGLAYAFFRRQGPKVTMPVFAALLVSAVCYGWAVTRLHNEPTFRISGRVLDSGTSTPIAQAKIHLNWGLNPQTEFSDSEGEYIFITGETGASRPERIRLSVEADGYVTYTRTVADPLVHMPQEIQMHKKEGNQSQIAESPVTKLAGGKLSPMSCEEESSLRSGRMLKNTTIEFKNLTPTMVQVYWIDYQGKEQFYFEMPSGAANAESTYAGHL